MKDTSNSRKSAKKSLKKRVQNKRKDRKKRGEEQNKVKLSGIIPEAYEHPADRAALSSLRKVPGFDFILRKFIGLIGERKLRYLYLASAVRVTNKQFTHLNDIYENCLEIFDFKDRPELFVAQTPFVNAGAIGVKNPFIVLNSGTLHLLSDEELQFVIGHELGHIHCDHALYKTMLNILVKTAITRIGFPISTVALFAISAALNEWSRKAELSADRAGLLSIQDPWIAYTIIMKMAGGNNIEQMDITEFVNQVEEYEKGGSELDSMLKLFNLVGSTHPFAVMRLAELKKWVELGEYDRIISGDYNKSENHERKSVFQEFVDSARSYQDSYQDSSDPMFQFIKDIGAYTTETGSNILNKFFDKFGNHLNNKFDEDDS